MIQLQLALLMLGFTVGVCHYKGNALADINDSVNCGFLDPFEDTPELNRLPAAILKSADERYFLLTPEDGPHDEFYFRDGDRDLRFKTEELNLDSGFDFFSWGTSLRIAEIPIDAIGEELQGIVRRCAVSEKQFVEPKLGMRVKVVGQSYDRNSGAVEFGAIASLNDQTVNEQAPYGPQLPHHLVLPATKSLPSTSWVVADQAVEGIAEPVVGLVIGHTFFKSGHCFLDIQMLRDRVNGDFAFRKLLDSPPDVKPCSTVFIRNLKSPDRFQDNWVPNGLIKGSLDEELMQSEKDYLEIDEYKDHFGIPGCLVKSGRNIYLVVDAVAQDQLQAESVVCVINEEAITGYPLAKDFEYSVTPPIDIDGVFLAFRCRETAAINSVKSLFDLTESPEGQAVDFLAGRSISNAYLRGSLEEAVVYMSKLNADQGTESRANLAEFDSGIYPAALSAVSGKRERFFGLLGFNVQTQEPTIYTVEELRSFLPAR